MSNGASNIKPPKFFIINNGMKDLRGHYFETAISIAEAAKDLGWHPILAAHVTCKPGIVPQWLEFYPAFRTDHWMAMDPPAQEQDEILIDLAGYHQSSMDQILAGKATFQQFMDSRFFIHPALAPAYQHPLRASLFSRIKTRIGEIHAQEGMTGVIRKVAKKALKECLPPILWGVLQKIKSVLVPMRPSGDSNQDPHPDILRDLNFCALFKNDLSKILALADANDGDYVFLPTAHGRELLAITEIFQKGGNLPSFGLEYRHAMEFPLVPLPPGQEHSYVRQHRYYFEQAKKTGIPEKVSLFTDTSELAADYRNFSTLPFAVLPIPFRQEFLENHEVLPPGPNEKLRLVYLGDPREEKGFHLLPFLADFLARDYLATGKVTLEIQASIHPVNSEPKCINALTILKSFPKGWIEFHGLEGPLSPESYYHLVGRAHVILCPYDQATYRSRSSGTLTEAIAVGVPTIVPASTWLSGQQPEGTGLTFQSLQDFLDQTKKMIDQFDVFLTRAKSVKREWLKSQDPRHLIQVATQGKYKSNQSNIEAA